jgi:hypothetical protein
MKIQIKTELNTHKIGYKIFSKMMLNVKPGEINVSFNMMQNQAIPKLSGTDTIAIKYRYIIIHL